MGARAIREELARYGRGARDLGGSAVAGLASLRLKMQVIFGLLWPVNKANKILSRLAPRGGGLFTLRALRRGQTKGQTDNKMEPREAKMGQDGATMGPRWPKMAPRWRQDGPRWRKDGQDRTSMCYDRGQDWSRWCQDGAKMSQDGAKMAP